MSAAEQLARPSVVPVEIPRHLTLRSTKGRTMEIDGAITDGEINRTMDGPSTISLTIHDPHRRLLRNPMLVRGPGQLGYVDMKYDDVYWRLVKVEKNADDLTLTFEDRAVAYLRRHTKPRTAKRGKVTRGRVRRLARLRGRHRARDRLLLAGYAQGAADRQADHEQEEQEEGE